VLQHVVFVMKSGEVYKDLAEPSLVKALSEVQPPIQPEGAVPAW
jgi:hypothetical protein